MKRPVWTALGLVAALVVNLCIFMGIPMLTQVAKPSLEKSYESGILLARPKHLPPPEERKMPERPKPLEEEKPPEPPKPLKRQVKQNPRRQPKLAVNAPEMSFALNARLATGMAVSRPQAAAPAPPPPPPAPPARTSFNWNEVDEAPRILGSVEPVYPFSARRKGVEGRVVVRFLVNEEGHVEQPEIVEAEPQGVFEESALSAVRLWRFSPGRIKGDPVPTWVAVPLKFTLSS